MNRIASTGLFTRAIKYGERMAIVNTPVEGLGHHGSLTYNQLLNETARLSTELTKRGGRTDRDDINQERVAFMTTASTDYVCAQWGIWNAGGVAVPLSPLHPASDIEYFLNQSKASVVMADQDNYDKVKDIVKSLNCTHWIDLIKLDKSTEKYNNQNNNKYNNNNNQNNNQIFSIDRDRNAMIIYTSGTTNRPKGVVTTHANIEAQISTLVDAWGWTENDKILQVLPLHHVHGIINCLGSALWSGAVCEMMPKFSAKAVIDRFVQDKNGAPSRYQVPPLSVFMAVPTIYAKLIKYIETECDNDENRQEIKEAFQKLRLMVSGSSALPVPVMKKWKELSGHDLLERYGMTEIGMALSNPLHGQRIPGTVGFPLPGVETKVAKKSGELLIRGPQVFKEYFDNPKATAEAKDPEGWFATGDIVSVDKTGRYSIQGRASVDILKCSGYKVSALEVEREILGNEKVEDCAVVGIPSVEYGEVVAAMVVVKPGQTLSKEELDQYCRTHIVGYKLPRILRFVPEIPKNSMMKIDKKIVKKMIQDSIQIDSGNY
ncbi:hypothetical protein DFA_09639 [Cavenderia fasciculata]|uniref:Uncharacterized protein n=1 Tax=Cavenderia fasciculata TaxID=261658 RepID=F4Q868_CACFS|nr:uncharacterized protein DFA_09639 [Cavenderia fasciculata]EGG15968.1 hypothetical protein DFA_09639 [Cavenderia fasciculata]|eukprot:XP_004352293.1 hypothetical protein DFA_09639 [Cavenderia fasciculata]